MQKKSHAQFVHELKSCNSDIRVIGRYQGSKSQIAVFCLECKHQWNPKPNDLLRKIGCPNCYNLRRGTLRRKTHHSFVKEMKKTNSFIEVTGIYSGAHKTIKCSCTKCQYQWAPKAYNILNGHGCPKCSSASLKTTERFVSELRNVSPNIKVTGIYVGALQRIECECENGHRWKASPSNLLSGHGCGKCNRSNMEKFIRQVLNESSALLFDEQVKFTTCVNKRSLPFDFGNYKKHILIEYDGRHHFQEVKFFSNLNEVRRNDDIKNRWAHDNGYYLYRIPYTMDRCHVREEIERILKRHRIHK